MIYANRSLIIATALALLAAGPVDAAELAVIVNAGNPVTDLSVPDVRDYYLKRKPVWKNGEKVRPVDQRGVGQERELFLDKVLDINEEEFVRYWLERQYANADKPPTKVNDDDAVIKFVSTLPGAIGFVDKATLDASGAVHVKAVLVITD